MFADLSISPKHYAAIGHMDSDKGISLRFPRLVRLREDKKAEECTKDVDIVDMYKNQPNVVLNDD